MVECWTRLWIPGTAGTCCGSEFLTSILAPLNKTILAIYELEHWYGPAHNATFQTRIGDTISFSRFTIMETRSYREKTSHSVQTNKPMPYLFTVKLSYITAITWATMTTFWTQVLTIRNPALYHWAIPLPIYPLSSYPSILLPLYILNYWFSFNGTGNEGCNLQATHTLSSSSQPSSQSKLPSQTCFSEIHWCIVLHGKGSCCSHELNTARNRIQQSITITQPCVIFESKRLNKV